MVGGSEDDLARARPLFGHMGKNVFHAGPSGSGQAPLPPTADCLARGQARRAAGGRP